MSLCDLIGVTITIVRGAYTLAVIIRDSESLHAELKDTARRISTDLNVVGGVLDQLRNLAHRVTVTDENFLITSITSLRSVVTDTQTILEKVRRDRNFIQRLFMKKDEYRQRLHEHSGQLYALCGVIQGALPSITKIRIHRQEFLDFRKLFHRVPEKELSFYDFSIIEKTPNSILTIASEGFHTTRCLCYMKTGNEQFFISYQLRTWSALNPKSIILEERRRKFAANWSNKNIPNLKGSNSSLDSLSSTQSLSAQSSVPSAPSLAAAAAATEINNSRKKLDFSEFFMSSNDTCGMTFTRSSIYIATKCDITIFSLDKQEIIAQYGMEGDGPNSFRHISYIYIPPNDETNLYIVDRRQYAVHQYKIDGSGLRFEFVRRYVVIANVNQQCNLVSCAIYNKNLYVSDDANNCLHIFPLNGERQSSYLCDNSMTPFSPGSLCAHGKYLYVANCSAESPGIIVFNEECQPVDWFRNHSLQEILAIDIDPNINELYVLTTTMTKSENDEPKKRPLIVSMDLVIHSKQS